MTAFGVFWGLLMLILLVGAGLGISNGITSGLTVIPSNSIFMGGGHTTKAYKGFGKDRQIGIDNQDVEIIRTNLGERGRFFTPLSFGGSKIVNYGEENGSFDVVATSPGYYYAIPQQMVFGRYLNDIDAKERRKVCVIGQKIYDTLFPNGDDPCGRLCLHAFRLDFRHPITGEHMHFETPMPKAFLSVFKEKFVKELEQNQQ